MLDNDINIYKHHTLASPFFNWDLSMEIFSSPDYYESVIKVHKGIIHDPPDIIRDREDKLKPFLERIPDLKEDVRKEDIFYVKKKVSN